MVGGFCAVYHSNVSFKRNIVEMRENDESLFRATSIYAQILTRLLAHTHERGVQHDRVECRCCGGFYSGRYE